MKTFLKSVMAVALVTASLAVAPKVQAQQYAANTVLSNLTVTAAANSNYNTIISVGRYQEVGLVFRYTPAVTGTTNVWVTLSQGATTNNWSTVNKFQLSLPGVAAGTEALLATNLYVGSLGYLKLESVTNAFQSASITNLYITVSEKPSRFLN